MASCSEKAPPISIQSQDFFRSMQGRVISIFLSGNWSREELLERFSHTHLAVLAMPEASTDSSASSDRSVLSWLSGQWRKYISQENGGTSKTSWFIPHARSGREFEKQAAGRNFDVFLRKFWEKSSYTCNSGKKKLDLIGRAYQGKVVILCNIIVWQRIADS